MDSSEIRLLRALRVLLRERSVSRAAHLLGLSQPATSHVLSRAREMFGDPLLLRARNGMVPTERALELDRQIQKLLEDYDLLVEPPATFDPAISHRTFTVSAPEFAERVLVPPLVSRMRREAPNVRLAVHLPNPQQSFALLERGELDLRIAWLIPAPVPSLRSVRLFTDRLVCVADRAHPSVRGVLTLDAFLSLPHLRAIGFSNTTTGRALGQAIERQGRKLDPTLVVQSSMTMLEAIVGTDMLSIVPSLLAKSFMDRAEVQVLQIPLQLPAMRYAAYWHERFQKDAGHRWFRRLLADVGRSVSG